MLKCWGTGPIVLAGMALAFSGSNAKEIALEGRLFKGQAFGQELVEAIERISEVYVLKLNQGEMAGWAIRGLYQHLEEKQPPDIVARLAKIKDMKDKERVGLLVDVWKDLDKKNKRFERAKVLDVAIVSIAGNLGHATYRPEPRWTHRAYVPAGIGLELSSEPGTGIIRVVTPIKDSPAYKAGIRAGDIIDEITLKVDDIGQPLAQPEVVSTKGLTLAAVEAKIWGKPGTKIQLTLLRAGRNTPLAFEVLRQKVEPETVLGNQRKKDDNWDYWIDAEKKVGYVRLTRFTQQTVADLTRVLNDLRKQGMRGLIVDLRFSPGGLLHSAVDIGGTFADEGLVVTIRTQTDEESHTGKHEKSLSHFPIVILVNEETAGTAEVVAACLQDHKRATIVGQRSMGKGYISTVIPVGEGELVLPMALFYRPSGKKLDKMAVPGRDADEWGVVPDPGFDLKLSPREHKQLADWLRGREVIRSPNSFNNEGKPAFKDRQLELALECLRGKIKRVSR